MSFEPLTMEPSGVKIAGWNVGTFEPPPSIDPVETEIIVPVTADWDVLDPIPAGDGFLMGDIDGHAFTFYEDEIPQEMMDIDDDGTPECAWGMTIIFGGIVLEQCGWPEAVALGGIVLGHCAATFNESVFPPPTPPEPPIGRCPEAVVCDIVPEITFLQEVNE